MFLSQKAQAMTKEPVHNFARRNPRIANGPLVEGLNGFLYGSTTTGGDAGAGFLFRLQTNGVMETVLSFNDQVWVASGSLTRVRSGQIYGQGRNGIVRLTIDEKLVSVADFTEGTGSGLAGNLVEGKDGALYGLTASGGPFDCGTFFRLTVGGDWTVLTALECETFDGKGLEGKVFGLTAADDGNFFGTSSEGGTHGLGSIFRLTSEGVISTIVSFDGTNGSGPTGGVILAPDGQLYGTTSGIDFDGRRNLSGGTVFSLAPGGKLRTLHTFSLEPRSTTQGAYPRAPLVVGADGNLYGTTSDVDSDRDDAGFGTVFRVRPDGKVATVFQGIQGLPGVDSAWYPEPLTPGRDGWVYSIAMGGRFGAGIVFRVNGTGASNEVVSFTNVTASGGTPRFAVSTVDGGFLVGTDNGGLTAEGSILRVEADGRSGPITSFGGLTGRRPTSLVHDGDGVYFGTTAAGGTHGAGTLFRFSNRGLEHLYSLSPNRDGRTPRGLIRTKSGRIYGMTTGDFYGPTEFAGGTIFELGRDGTMTTLHRFSGNTWSQSAGLVEGQEEQLFGFASNGGSRLLGTVFAMASDGSVTTLYSFGSGSDVSPTALVMGIDGLLYGTCGAGGTFNSGVVFRLDVQGGYRRLHSFSGGRFPSDLIRTKDGAIYGVTGAGGRFGNGTFFSIRPDGSVITLGSFADRRMLSSLAEGGDGNLYGISTRPELLRIIPRVGLQVRRMADELLMSWPYEAEGYVVQFTESLSQPDWRSKGVGSLVFPSHVQTNAISASSGYFRLGRTD